MIFTPKILMSAALLFAGITLQAQSLTPEIVASSGGHFSSVTTQISWTLGEPVIDTWSNVSNTLTQGFHQNQHYLNGVEELNENISVSIYPNPSSGLVNIAIKEAAHPYTQAVLTDINGNMVHQLNLTGLQQATIDLAAYSCGTYVLSIHDNQSQKQNLTLIKQ